jgi:hypothetical protein
MPLKQEVTILYHLYILSKSDSVAAAYFLPNDEVSLTIVLYRVTLSDHYHN